MNDLNDGKFGLKTGDLKAIIAVIQQTANIEQALIFGSRAKGNYRNGSDIDIALKGEINFHLVTQISFSLNEESNLPYKFDVLNYLQIDNKQLREHIDRVGIVFYQNAAKRLS